jgi:hypothetical protein
VSWLGLEGLLPTWVTYVAIVRRPLCLTLHLLIAVEHPQDMVDSFPQGEQAKREAERLSTVEATGLV